MLAVSAEAAEDHADAGFTTLSRQPYLNESKAKSVSYPFLFNTASLSVFRNDVSICGL